MPIILSDVPPDKLWEFIQDLSCSEGDDSDEECGDEEFHDDPLTIPLAEIEIQIPVPQENPGVVNISAVSSPELPEDSVLLDLGERSQNVPIPILPDEPPAPANLLCGLHSLNLRE